jgi:hypothetical protein
MEVAFEVAAPLRSPYTTAHLLTRTAPPPIDNGEGEEEVEEEEEGVPSSQGDEDGYHEASVIALPHHVQDVRTFAQLVLPTIIPATPLSSASVQPMLEEMIKPDGGNISFTGTGTVLLGV